jgi:hypothetical protein
VLWAFATFFVRDSFEVMTWLMPKYGMTNR